MQTPRRDTNGTPGQALTVAEVAARYGVTAEVVLAWISSGDLRAINAARSARGKRPTWRITVAALEAFEAARSATPEPPATKRMRRQKPTDVIQFYK